MKKFFVLLAVGLFMGNSFAQSCLSNVWMCLSNKQLAKARKEIDNCMIGNEKSAEAWLFKGNVYLLLADQERERVKADPKYVSKTPDAIWIAYESFMESKRLEVETNTTVEPRSGIIDAKKGQAFCAIPLYNNGLKAMDEKKDDLAHKYLNAAIKCFKLDKPSQDQKTFLGYAYYYVAIMDLTADKKDDYKKTLKEAVNDKVTVPAIYLLAYEMYRAENDTVECGKVVKTAKAIVPDTTFYTKEMDYLSMTGQQEKLDALLDTLIKKYNNKPSVLGGVAEQLTYNGMYEKARNVIDMGLKIAPSDFELTKRMGFLFCYEADNYQQKIEEAVKARQNFNEIKKIQDQRKDILENAYTWLDKAYQLNGTDRENNVMLQKIIMMTGRTVPDDLKQKIDSYKKHD